MAQKNRHSFFDSPKLVSGTETIPVGKVKSIRELFEPGSDGLPERHKRETIPPSLKKTDSLLSHLDSLVEDQGIATPHPPQIHAEELQFKHMDTNPLIQNEGISINEENDSIFSTKLVLEQTEMDTCNVNEAQKSRETTEDFPKDQALHPENSEQLVTEEDTSLTMSAPLVNVSAPCYRTLSHTKGEPELECNTTIENQPLSETKHIHPPQQQQQQQQQGATQNTDLLSHTLPDVTKEKANSSTVSNALSDATLETQFVVFPITDPAIATTNTMDTPFNSVVLLELIQVENELHEKDWFQSLLKLSEMENGFESSQGSDPEAKAPYHLSPQHIASFLNMRDKGYWHIARVLSKKLSMEAQATIIKSALSKYNKLYQTLCQDLFVSAKPSVNNPSSYFVSILAELAREKNYTLFLTCAKLLSTLTQQRHFSFSKEEYPFCRDSLLFSFNGLETYAKEKKAKENESFPSSNVHQIANFSHRVSSSWPLRTEFPLTTEQTETLISHFELHT